MAGALGVVITTDVPMSGQHAQPVYVDDSLPIVGPSQAIVVTSGEVPQMGGPPIAVRLAPAGTPAIGPALPVYVVPGGGSLGVTVLAPVNTVLPAISGTVDIGQTLTASTGTWANTPTSYTYQWKRAGVAIGGATNSAYLLVVADNGAAITVTVTATNAGGSAAATSAAVNVLNYRLLARFETPEAAPIATPHVDDIGTETVIQTNGNIGISGGKAALPVGTLTNFTMGWYGTTNLGRVAGAALHQTFDLTTISDAAPLAWSKSATINFSGFANMGSGVYISTSLIRAIDNAVGVSDVAQTNLLTGAIYQIAIIQQAAGALITIEGGIYTRPTLLWPCIGDSTTTQHPATSNAKSAYNVDRFAVADLPAPYVAQYGLATSRTAVPVSGATGATEIEFIAEFTWTPASAEVMEFDVRYVSANDRWIIRCDQAGSTIKLFEREAGVEVQKQTAAQTFTIGTPYRIVQIQTVGWYNTIVNNTSKWNNVVSAVQPVDLYSTGLRVTGFATGANLIGWPKTMPAYAFGLNRALSSFFILADSKAPYNGFPTTLQKNISTASAAWANAYPQCDIGSYTWALMRLVIDARMAAFTGTAPTAVLANLGVNDVVALPAEATLKADVNYCLDAMHTKWPNAIIYLARVWRRTEDVDCATLNGWLNDIITARADTVAGPNEAVWLQNGDDGVTYTSDGVHYNAAGIAQAAVQWQTAMGL